MPLCTSTFHPVFLLSKQSRDGSAHRDRQTDLTCASRRNILVSMWPLRAVLASPASPKLLIHLVYTGARGDLRLPGTLIHPIHTHLHLKPVSTHFAVWSVMNQLQPRVLTWFAVQKWDVSAALRSCSERHEPLFSLNLFPPVRSRKRLRNKLLKCMGSDDHGASAKDNVS